MRPREGLLRAEQLVMEPERLLYRTNRWRRLLWPSRFVRRQVEDRPRHGVEGRGWNVGRFGQLGWRLRTLADVLTMAWVGRRETLSILRRIILLIVH